MTSTSTAAGGTELTFTLSARLLQIATAWPVRNMLGWVTEDKVPIFVLHRIEKPESGIRGFSPNKLRAYLRFLQNRGAKFVSLEEVFRRFQGVSKHPLNNAVAFTMDGGFEDQVELALPIFVEFDCPVTVFVTTGFIDRNLWRWDDKVAHMLEETKKSTLKLFIAGRELSYDLRIGGLREFARRDLQTRFKQLSSNKLKMALESLSFATQVTVPGHAPTSFKPATWSSLRSHESPLISFGPHTVSHGILSKMDDDAAAYELKEAWKRVRKELASPLPVVAWPNGRREDYGPREMSVLEGLNLLGAVTNESEVADLRPNARHSLSSFQIERLSMPDNMFDLIQYTSWITHAKWLIRKRDIQDRFVGRRQFFNVIWHRSKSKLGMYRDFEDIDWPRVRRLIFLCKGNICRSPYAAAKAIEYGLAAISAGLDAAGSSPANLAARHNAAYRGVDLTKHESTKFEDVRLNESDIVICMTPEQVHEIRRERRAVGCQVTLLGLFSDPMTPHLPDPYGSTDAYFVRCFQYIDSAIAKISILLAHDNDRNEIE